jgi:ATP-binding cassette, subfamily B, multidrug efflux pump
MKNLRELKKYFVQYKKKLIWGFFFIVLSNAGMVYIPLLIKDAINSISVELDISTLITYAFLIIGTSLISGVFRFFIRQTIIVVSREIEFDLRYDFWKHIQSLPLRYFQNNSTGNVMAHATNDINAVRNFIGPAVMYSIDTALRLVVVVIIMFSLNIQLTLLALLPLPILSVLVNKVGKKIHARFTLIQEKFSDLTTKAQETYSGIRVVKSFVREEYETEQFKVLSREYLKRNMSMVKIQALFQPLLFLITGLSAIIVIGIGGAKVIAGDMNIGEITAFIVYLGILTWPMIAIGWVINIIQQAEASMQRLNKIFAEEKDVADTDITDHSKQSIKGSIEFKDLSFRYADHLPYVLKNINLNVPPGSTLAIIGHTGSGKTTLINMISRLYDPVSGQVFVDDIDTKQIPVAVLRTSIGMVQQEPFLFSDTISNNISYGLREINIDKVKEVSEIAQFHNDVATFPDNYDTIMGERGITLSGGQKQRASLARALAINPKILILDDSFSAVDTHTEEQILNNLRNFMKDRTSIIISHRISTVKDADKIIVLSEGTIAEEGTHDQLVQKKGIYADLHYKQLLEKELEELN